MYNCRPVDLYNAGVLNSRVLNDSHCFIHYNTCNLLLLHVAVVKGIECHVMTRNVDFAL